MGTYPVAREFIESSHRPAGLRSRSLVFWQKNGAAAQPSGTVRRFDKLPRHRDIRGSGYLGFTYPALTCLISPQKISTLPLSGAVRTNMECSLESRTDSSTGAVLDMVQPRTAWRSVLT